MEIAVQLKKNLRTLIDSFINVFGNCSFCIGSYEMNGASASFDILGTEVFDAFWQKY